MRESYQFSSVQSLSQFSRSLRPHEPQDAGPPCPSPTPAVPNLVSQLIEIFLFCCRRQCSYSVSVHRTVPHRFQKTEVYLEGVLPPHKLVEQKLDKQL